MPSKFIILAGLLFFLSAIPVCCEFYQYTDKNGVKHFTDNLADVPENQREKLSIHQSTQSTQPRQENTPAAPEPESPATSETPAAPETSVITSESLVMEKDALDKEYNSLLKQRQSLNEQKQDIGEKKYNELAAELNQKIHQYQTRSDALKNKITEYNQKATSMAAESDKPENDTRNPEE